MTEGYVKNDFILKDIKCYHCWKIFDSQKEENVSIDASIDSFYISCPGCKKANFLDTKKIPPIVRNRCDRLAFRTNCCKLRLQWAGIIKNKKTLRSSFCFIKTNTEVYTYDCIECGGSKCVDRDTIKHDRHKKIIDDMIKQREKKIY